MKQALISPAEKLSLNVLGEPVRVAQVSEQGFPVAPPLFWVDCEDHVCADLWYFDLQNQTILQMPEEPEPVQPAVDGAQTL